MWAKKAITGADDLVAGIVAMTMPYLSCSASFNPISRHSPTSILPNSSWPCELGYAVVCSTACVSMRTYRRKRLRREFILSPRVLTAFQFDADLRTDLV